MGNLVNQYKTERNPATGKRERVGGFTYYADYIDIRTGQRPQVTPH